MPDETGDIHHEPQGGPALDPAPRRQPRATARSLIPSGQLGRRGKDMTADERSRLFEELFFEDERRVPFLWRFATLTFLSTTIATLGMLNNSTAVVIGAMLVAPLMTPILAIAAALVQGWGRRQAESALVLLLGAALAVATAWLLTELMPGTDTPAQLPQEVLSRTAPNLLDLGIAIAAGAAGAYIMVRKEAGSALPGVAIAVALVPPLSALGITLAVGESELAEGAFLLFITNLAAIVLAAGIVFLAAGFVAPAERLRRKRAVQVDLGIVVVVVIAVAVPLALHTRTEIDQSNLSDAAATAVTDWDPSLEVVFVEVVSVEDPDVVEVTVTGVREPGSVEDLANLISAKVGQPVVVKLSFVKQQPALGASD